MLLKKLSMIVFSAYSSRSRRRSAACFSFLLKVLGLHEVHDERRE